MVLSYFRGQQWWMFLLQRNIMRHRQTLNLRCLCLLVMNYERMIWCITVLCGDILKCKVTWVTTSVFCCSFRSYITDYNRWIIEITSWKLCCKEPTGRKAKWTHREKKESLVRGPNIPSNPVLDRESNLPLHRIVPGQIISLKAIFFLANYQSHLPQIQIMPYTIL